MVAKNGRNKPSTIANIQRMARAIRPNHKDKEAYYGLDGPVPEGLDPEQGEVYKSLLASSQTEGSGFDEAAAEIIARNPIMAKQYLEQLRKRTIERVAAHLSECTKLVDLPLEVVEAILSLPGEDSMHYFYAMTEIAKAKLNLTSDEVRETVDLARVIHVMEEEDQEKLDPGIKEDYKVVGQKPVGQGGMAKPIDQEEWDELAKEEQAPDHTTRTIWARQARARLAR